MLQQLDNERLTEAGDIHLRFALGKAFEDRQDYDQAWQYYHTGNQRQRMTVTHDPLELEYRFKAVREVFSPEFIEQHNGKGCAAPDPIFIVGLPRSGSTLVEQILASHSQVEGTAELPVLGRLANSIGRYRTDGIRYPESVRELRDRDWRAYGEQYLEESRRYRLTDRPIFTDKLPNNFPFVGLIHLILPNAKIINARRHPFDSCLGGYKQLFGQGQNFTYDLLDLAHYYQQYDTTMKHWHEVLPGKVLDVHYEETVTDLENQVAKILAHCGLPFEESCVRFHETRRAGEYGELRAGAATDLYRGARQVAPLREAPRRAAEAAWLYRRRIAGGGTRRRPLTQISRKATPQYCESRCAHPVTAAPTAKYDSLRDRRR